MARARIRWAFASLPGIPPAMHRVSIDKVPTHETHQFRADNWLQPHVDQTKRNTESGWCANLLASRRSESSDGRVWIGRIISFPGPMRFFLRWCCTISHPPRSPLQLWFSITRIHPSCTAPLRTYCCVATWMAWIWIPLDKTMDQKGYALSSRVGRLLMHPSPPSPTNWV